MATDSLNAFDALADLYQSYRPTYPDRIFQELASQAGGRADANRLAIDVGAGTGIATRQLATALGPNWTVLGVEPSGPMLDAARQQGRRGIAFAQGTAESLPVDNAGADIVMAAQAVQWFNRPLFYTEAARVLEVGGIIALVQNNRDWRRSRLLDAYETFLETHSPGYSRDYRVIDFAEEFQRAGFRAAPPLSESWTRRLSAEQFVGMTGSSTKMQAAIRALGEAPARKAIDALLVAHGGRTYVEIPYVSELFVATKVM